MFNFERHGVCSESKIVSVVEWLTDATEYCIVIRAF